jgi:hypothetical protein
MKSYNSQAAALQAIRRNFAGGKTQWVRFQIANDKVARKQAEMEAELGTNMAPWRRQKRHQKKRPTAAAVCSPAFGRAGHAELIIMATDHVRSADPDSPWARQRWIDQRPPEFGPFVMVREPNNQRKITWTWRLRDEEIDGRSHYLVSLVKSRNAAGLRNECEAWLNLYPMASGVRRQLYRLLTSAIKLWEASHGTPWPSITPKQLPVHIGFRSDRTPQKRRSANEGAKLLNSHADEQGK